MFVRDEFGNIIFLPRNMAFADGEGEGEGGGSGGEGEGADTGTGGEGGDTQQGGEGEGGKTKLGGSEGDTLEGGDKGGEGKSWRDGLDDDLKKSAEKFASPADVLRSYAELQKRLGKSVTLPGKDAKPEEVTAFHKALGVPEKPEDYKVEIPEAVKESWGEADEALKGSFLGKLHAAGAPPAVVNAAMGWYFEATQKMAEDRAAAQKKATETADEALRKEWGEDYKPNLAVAARAAKEFGGEEFAEFLNKAEVDGVKLGDHPAFAKAFAQIGRAMSEDKPLIGQDADAAQTAKEAADEARRKRNEAQAKGDRAGVQKWDEEERRLLAKIYGNGSIVGQEGRTY